MKTTTTSELKSHELDSNSFSIIKWFNKQADHFEKTRFGWMAIYITISSCVGSIACMLILENNGGDFMLITCAAISMAANSLFIAQGDAKWCMAIFYLSLIINGILIIINM
ncbi:MAG: hypothetical protein ABI315_12060 [Bacteroidia bacterium]